MSSIETLRAVLVASAVLAAVVAGMAGLWLPAGVLLFGVLVHGILTPYIRRQAPQAPQTPRPSPFV